MMLSDFSLLLDSIFNFLADIFSLYTGSILLSGVLLLWLLRKVVRIFNSIK